MMPFEEKHLRKLSVCLKNLGISVTRSYYDEVFGKQEGTVYQGLLVATSEDEFDARLHSLTKGILGET